MRESIGGAMMFYIVLTFMFIFITLLASITQYGKIFRVKNKMINYMEQKEGVEENSGIAEFNQTLRANGYGVSNPDTSDYILCKNEVKSSSRNNTYYTLTLYMYFQLPYWPPIKTAIKGETRMLVTGVYFDKDAGRFDNKNIYDGLDCYLGNTFKN